MSTFHDIATILAMAAFNHVQQAHLECKGAGACGNHWLMIADCVFDEFRGAVTSVDSLQLLTCGRDCGADRLVIQQQRDRLSDSDKPVLSLVVTDSQLKEMRGSEPA